MGAGKSTMTSFLESRFGIRPFYEPNDANPYLADFYKDMKAYAFHSQMYFLSAKFRAHLELAQLLDDHPETVFVQDRTIYEDAEIFATNLHQSKHLNDRDYETYMRMYGAIRDSLPRPDLLIYLRCSTKTIRKRIAQRGRREEQKIAPAYLNRLHRAYEAWFERYDLSPTLVIESERLDYLSHIVDRLDLTAALERVLHNGAPTRQ
ncbi:MAG TPA: deoxynucleoside kinase [Myxococcales bacterium]|nr:deoxynucleoside kinase [Myxococcales bacterium]HAN32060.1 deoxynucleoside kinase [Myxococcales bacterium]